jgi:poly(3-hydroxyalkanoate) synthetase
VELQDIADLAIPVAASMITSLENLFACALLLPGKSEISLSRIGHISHVICQMLTGPTPQVLSTHSATVLNAWLEFIYERADELVGYFLNDQISRVRDDPSDI